MDLTCLHGHPNPPGTMQCNACDGPVGPAEGDSRSLAGIGVVPTSDGGVEPADPESAWIPVDSARPASAAPALDIHTPASRHGWRMTLPNHAVVPLEEGMLAVGRATLGPIGPVLQLFPHVSRHHVTLNVTEDMVMVYVAEGASNPVFTVRRASSSASSERHQLRPVTRSASIDRHGQMTLCLGQCCFIHIDRGQA